MPDTASQQQLDVLRSLPANRPLLLQYQLSWADDRSVDRISTFIRQVQKDGGSIISQASVDMLAIGASEHAWDDIFLIEFDGPGEVEAHISGESVKTLLASCSDCEVLVASQPPPKVQKVINLLNRFMPWLPKPRKGKAMPEEELQGGINPTVVQMTAFREADQSCGIHMFNLLKFHERARYAEGDRGLNGRQAYEKGYGQVAMSCFLRLGGRIVAFGRYRMTLIGAGGDPSTQAWDEIAVVQYPNRPAFAHMVSNPGYIAALEHRHAGLAETQVWSTAPPTGYLG